MLVALVRIEVRGLMLFDVLYTIREFVLPVLLVLFDLLLVPYFLARCAGWVLVYHSATSYTICTMLLRYSYHACLLLRLVVWAGSYAWTIIQMAEAELCATKKLDLAGAQLRNRE